MPYRITRPHETFGDDSKPGYKEYGREDGDGEAPAPRLHPSPEGHAGSYGQHDFSGSARRSRRRSDQRYHDSAADKA